MADLTAKPDRKQFQAQFAEKFEAKFKPITKEECMGKLGDLTKLMREAQPGEKGEAPQELRQAFRAYVGCMNPELNQQPQDGKKGGGAAEH